MWGRSAARQLAAGLLTVVMVTALTVTPAMAAGERRLVPVGHTVGIKLFARGVVVAGVPLGESPARACGLRAGDVIEACGGQAVTSTEQFQQLLQQGDTELSVRREDRRLALNVEPERNPEGVYCIGAWVRDSMAGIGTLTYYDPVSREFGALGHGITDVDTALLMPFGDGSILPARVKEVRRGQRGQAGELRGEFRLTETLGPLRANTDGGIFGTLTGAMELGEALELGRPQPGPAEILANVDGDRVQRYDVEILKATAGDRQNLVLRVTDPALLAKTGGIVQGMSGSPIIQDGKFVGAVTHVFLNDPTKGYGISMDSMLKAAE